MSVGGRTSIGLKPKGPKVIMLTKFANDKMIERRRRAA
jgi:hypothetical protein